LKGKKAGATGWIVKPFNADQLVFSSSEIGEVRSTAIIDKLWLRPGKQRWPEAAARLSKTWPCL